MSVPRKWLKVFDIPEIGDVLVRLDHDYENSTVAVVLEWLEENCENGCCPVFEGAYLTPATSNLSKALFEQVDREAVEGIVREALRAQGKRYDFLKEDKRPDSVVARFAESNESYTESVLERREGRHDFEQGFLELIDAFNGAIDALPEQERELLTKINGKVESLVVEKITERQTGISQKFKH